MLNFYGVYIFLCVGEVDDRGVYVYELKTIKERKKEYAGYTRLSYNFTTRRFNGKKIKDCLVVPKSSKGNSFFSKSLYIEPIRKDKKVYLPIKVSYYCPLFEEAVKLGLFKDSDIICGTYYAKKVCSGTKLDMNKLRRTYFKQLEITYPEEIFWA